MPRRVRVLFIGGLGRSGSTLLERMLGQLDGFCPVGELVHVWERGLQANNLCGCGEQFRDCPFWRKVGEEAFGGWDALDVEQVLALKRSVDRNRYVPLMLAPGLSPAYRARLDRYLDLLGRLYQAVRLVSGAEVVVDATKHASHAFLLRRLAGVDLRLVHLVRDSRGVAFSWTRLRRQLEVPDGEALMATDRPLRSSGRYLAYNLLFHLLRRLGVASLLQRYESLVADPAGQLRRAATLAGRTVAERELGFIGDGYLELGPSHALAGNPMRFRQGRVPVRLDEAWRREMPRAQRLLTATSTLPLLLRYGYLHGAAHRDR
ncbi:MAG TPA: sulfotransferase [Actinomycetes bacterium]|nr:sulfotransferase [Actinomycetes bacterium]